MPYAINDKLSKSPISGGIEISDVEYKAAVQAKMQGRKVYVDHGALLIESEETRTVYSTEAGKEKEIPENRPLPGGYTEQERPSRHHKWDGSAWVEDVSSAQDAKRDEIVQARKAAEAEGVKVKGVRYSGSAANRATLIEAVQFAEQAQSTTFARWKDSDGQYHPNHPVADVQQALNEIATRRGQLIAQEGDLVDQINSATTVTEVESIEWVF